MALNTTDEADCRIHVYAMSRLKETQVAVISSSFYKNVSLLAQIVPPSLEFQRHFKKDMFDKPNTVGFLHVSHYLSTVYDAKLFKRMVRWPILCKKDEATYRVEMKNFLCLLSQDNPDLNFPTILMSHLIQSAGTKFQTIMWKLSQLALKTYIKRELQGELLNAPCISPVQDLAIKYFNNIIVEKYKVVTETREETEKILDAANNFLNDEIERLNTYKSEIFDRRENIRRVVPDLPAHPLVQKQLMNVEDSNITNCWYTINILLVNLFIANFHDIPSRVAVWKRSIFKKVQYIIEKNKEFKELEKSFDRLCKLVLRINSNSRTLDANEFSEIFCDNCLLYTQSETQSKHLIRNLHANGSIVFNTLLSLLYLMVTQIHRESIADLSDLSQCLPSIRSACKKMKSLRTLFSALNTRIGGICRNEQCAVSREIKNVYIDFDASNVPIVNRYILLRSPKISFNLDQSTDDKLFYERLRSSPVEGKHKHLFRRYRHKYRPLRELPARPAPLLDFSSSWNNMSGWLSPRARSVKREQILVDGKPLSPLYSRLLQHSKGHASRSPGTNYEGLNLTPRKRPSRTGHLTTHGGIRNFF
ncbi:uncharacterized protein LOC143899933 isoform X2 [Temnothorax americanus]|uniref:uncharacterized protein LOC143899933 isoform X2 n=1 Tax=Temnothorax americanus TaxID=1964332 RepID=UPI004068F40D